MATETLAAFAPEIDFVGLARWLQGEKGHRTMSRADELDRIRRVKAGHEADLLRKRNVVGVGVGRREVGGRMTEQLCLIVMVDRKVPLKELAPEDRIPSEIEGVCVDVQAVGRIKAL